MSEKDHSEESDFPSPEGMRGWLKREIADIMKAAELRVKDASELVVGYSAGEVSRQQAEALSNRYAERWGDALPGTLRPEGKTDSEILEALDRANGERRIGRRTFSRSSSTERGG
jgi:hypothetical protein